MAQIPVTALSQMLPEDVTSDYNMIVFTADGDTNQVEFQSAVSQANVNNGCECIHSAKLVIPSADVLTLNSSPKAFGITVPSGYYANVLTSHCKYAFNTTPYATNTAIQIRCAGATVPQISYIGGVISILEASATTFAQGEKKETQDITIVDGADIEVYVPSGNPTAGDSDITIYITYMLIQI